MDLPPAITTDIALEQLFSRPDIWRGDSRTLAPQVSVDSGFADLNAGLLNHGWPTRSLIEVCQKGLQLQEWILFAPVVKAYTGYIVLLNPPALPFCQALIQAGVDLERVIVVQVSNTADFLASFVELARTESCAVLLAWQAHHMLSYTELRKCLLASNEGAGISVLFRPESAQQQSSPASLRLSSEINTTDMSIRIFKQKGTFQQHQLISLALPKIWQGVLPYHLLDQTPLPIQSGNVQTKRKSALVLPLKRGKR